MILKVVNKTLQPLLNIKSTAKIWTILEDHFQYISPMSITRIFSDTCNLRLLDCKDIIDYTSHYQIVFDKILYLINDNKDSWISRKICEITLQRNLLRHYRKDYSALVLAIKTM